MEKYFNEFPLGKEIWNKKYKDKTQDTDIYSTWKRVANSIGKNETQEVRDQFYHILSEGYFVPGGRITNGAGTKHNYLMNCSVRSVEDSLDEIYETIKKSAKMFKCNYGVGYSFHKLRPKDAILSKGGKSSGVVSFMKVFDSSCAVIQSGGENRRGAQLGALPTSHPDIFEFIDAKHIDKELSNFNISVSIDKTFIDAVKNDSDYDLVWEGKVYRTVKAKDIWKKLCESGYKYNDPGILNLYEANKYNNLWYLDQFFATNPCQPAFATVLTPDGIKTIGDINIGDTIWSGKQWTKVVNKWFTGNKQVNSYNTTAGSFVGTENHRVVQNGKKIEVKDASSIDVCKVENREVYVKDLQSIMDGLVIGDGSFHKASNNLVYLCIGKNDKDYFESEIKDLIIKNRRSAFGTGWEIDTTVTFEELKKTYEREIPNRFHKASPSIVASFLRGLYSANGSIAGGRVTLKQSSLVLIKQVQEMLSSLGIRSYYTTNKSTNVKFENGDYRCKQSYDLNITKDRQIFYDNIGFIQKYKMIKLENILSTVKSAIRTKETYDINSIDDMGFHDVFDLTVEADEHTYWTGGLLVSNCGEIFLFPDEVCCLASLNLTRFITNPFTNNYKFDSDKFIEVVEIATRFLDNVIDVSDYPFEEIKKTVQANRRIGLNVVGGLGSALAMMKLPYDSEEGINFAEMVQRLGTNTAYNASIKLSQEKGAFSTFIADKFCDGEFIKKLEPELQDGIRSYGIRNCALITIPPMGTGALLLGNISSGMEPIFSLEYERRVRQDDNSFKSEVVDDYSWRLYKSLGMPDGENPKYFKTARDINPLKHIDMQAALQKWVCNSISKTCNIPEDCTYEEYEELLMYAIDNNVKGFTSFREGTREGILTTKDEKEKSVKELKKEQKEFYDTWEGHDGDEIFEEVQLPEEYPSKGFTLKSEGKKWYLHCCYKDRKMTKPFALFVHTNNKESCIVTYTAIDKLEELATRKGIPEQHITKNKQKCGDQNNINKLARTISLLLRHNVKIDKIVKVLDDIEEIPISSFLYRIKKFLSKYMKEDVTSEKCPECGADIINQGGCKECSKLCGYSRC